MLLPREFLTKLAHEHKLSPEQTEVLVLRFSEGKKYKEIAQQLNTTYDACLKRMGQVYQKFGIEGGTRGKENKLRFYLIQVQNPEYNGGETAISSPMDKPSESTRIFSNLPKRAYTKFVGRNQELGRLLQLLSFERGSNLISIDGVGGVGKTTLVLEAAYRCLEVSQRETTQNIVEEFEAIIFTSAKREYLTPDGILPRLQSERNLRDILRTIAKTLEKTEITYKPLEEQLEQIREILPPQTLLIIDNLDTIDETDQDKLLGFLYDLPSMVKTVITTRKQKLFVPIRLDCLPQEDGLALINHEFEEKLIKPNLSNESHQVQDLSSEETVQLYEKTNGIPAAIVYAIGQLAYGYQLEDILNRIAEATGDVARFIFSDSVNSLKEQPAHKILMTLALLPRPVEQKTLQEITLEDQIGISQGLAQLQQLSLIRVHQKQKKYGLQQQRYGLLPFTRKYALAELSSHTEFGSELRDRWINHYLEFSKFYESYDWREYQAEYLSLELEWQNLQAVLEWCMAHNRNEEVLKNWQPIKGYAYIRGYWNELLEWAQWLQSQAQQRGEKYQEAQIMFDRGWILIKRGEKQNLEQAHALLIQARKLAQKQKDEAFQLEVETGMVILHIRQGNLEEAQRYLHSEQQLLKKAKLPDRQRQYQEVHILYYEAQILFKKEEYSQALKVFQQAGKLATTVGWKRAEVSIQNWMAKVIIEQIEANKQKVQEENVAEAQRLLDKTLDIAERNKDKVSIAFSKRTFAKLKLLQNNLKEAYHWAMEALEAFESLRMFSEAKAMQAIIKKIGYKYAE